MCVFSLKQKPGPKCNRHIGEAPPFREESLGVDAISSAAAALSLSGSKPGLAAAMAWSQSAKGKRGGRGSTSRAFSAAEKRPFTPGSVGDGIRNRDHIMDEVGINSFFLWSSYRRCWLCPVPMDQIRTQTVRAVSGDVMPVEALECISSEPVRNNFLVDAHGVFMTGFVFHHKSKGCRL